MPELEKPKRKTHTSTAVKQRYNAKAYDNINLVVKKGRKDELKAEAEKRGKSLNGFITECIESFLRSDQSV